jgi:hypothetical protein
MRGRSGNINSNDGNSVYRICVTMRDDELLRSNGDNKFNISDTICRRGHSAVSMRRVLSIKSNIK